MWRGSNCVAIIKGINQDRSIKCVVNVVEQTHVAPAFHTPNRLGHIETCDIPPGDILLISGNKSAEGEYFWESSEWDEPNLPLTGNLDIDTLLLQRRDTVASDPFNPA